MYNMYYKHVFIVRNSISTSKGAVIEPLRWAFVVPENMASISVNTGNGTLECAAEIYPNQTRLSNDYELFLSK